LGANKHLLPLSPSSYKKRRRKGDFIKQVCDDRFPFPPTLFVGGEGQGEEGKDKNAMTILNPFFYIFKEKET
jgi:hypothetical protein